MPIVDFAVNLAELDGIPQARVSSGKLIPVYHEKNLDYVILQKKSLRYTVIPKNTLYDPVPVVNTDISGMILNRWKPNRWPPCSSSRRS